MHYYVVTLATLFRSQVHTNTVRHRCPTITRVLVVWKSRVRYSQALSVGQAHDIMLISLANMTVYLS